VSARVRIDRKALGRAADRYGYKSLDGRMLDVEVVTRYGEAKARCAMKFVEKMNYPLMFIREVGPAGKRKPGAKGRGPSGQGSPEAPRPKRRS
jgi:hypothetical protein